MALQGHIPRENLERLQVVRSESPTLLFYGSPLTTVATRMELTASIITIGMNLAKTMKPWRNLETGYPPSSPIST